MHRLDVGERHAVFFLHVIYMIEITQILCSFSSDLHPETPDSDEALALRLQEEMDKEAADAHTEDLEDRGLFFCQICQRDLSHMSPIGRTQHLNRFDH